MSLLCLPLVCPRKYLKLLCLREKTNYRQCHYSLGPFLTLYVNMLRSWAKYLLNIYCVPRTGLGMKNITIEKADMPLPYRFYDQKRSWSHLRDNYDLVNLILVKLKTIFSLWLLITHFFLNQFNLAQISWRCFINCVIDGRMYYLILSMEVDWVP